ncbi:HAMP domain-containing sensor histidine kinase [Paraburkholderia sp. J8-2]|uniref:sensor histidine kinase n=1 Tax=Paraburkholderia sp. J8-2 TaxID=2805440 RepID=UPI002AB5F093|nr:HAMP domain-containing sensor histidine kinase [Paraburkholderia sp. J8-2]
MNVYIKDEGASSAAASEGGGGPVLPARRQWQSSSSRFIAAYATLFSVAVMLLLAFIGVSTTQTMERSTDLIIEWQLNYFDAFPPGEIEGVISDRLAHEHQHTAFYGLFDRNGKAVAGDVGGLPKILPSDRTGATFEHTLSIDARQTSPVVRAMVLRRPDGQILLVAHDLTHILSIQRRTNNALIVVGGICLLAGALFAWLLHRRQRVRIREIQMVTRKIAEGDLSERLPVKGRDELDMLADLVNHMLGEVERLMGEVKGACDGIAHDLRTPLGHVRAKLSHIADRAARYGDVDLDQRILDVRRETDHLLDRFRAMMRISEIGTLSRRGGFEDVALGELLDDIEELFEPLAESCSLTLSIRSGAHDVVHGDRALLFEALSNLVDNAIKFTPAGGKVEISLASGADGPRLEVSDTGVGIPRGERSAVLQRFFRSEHTQHVPGSGLGLSIVAAVVNLHGYSLRIEDAQPGTRISIECWSH